MTHLAVDQVPLEERATGKPIKLRLISDGTASGTKVGALDAEGNAYELEGVLALRFEIREHTQRVRLILEVSEVECDLTLLPEDVVVIPKPEDIPF